ncbi:MAG TPA: DUF5677 domain-containing protein [Anaerolineae bacterium]|nr:DUF5677 domain-containing protein [Anaerolineae bacterium]
MPKINPESYLPVESYAEVAQIAHGIWSMLLFEFARQRVADRDVMIRNLIARADKMVSAVFQLWSIQDYQDCWVLFRCLLERLFHLSCLDEQNEFELFEEWSFLEQYKAANWARSDPDLGGSTEEGILGLTPEVRERADRLLKAPPVWHRPRAKDVAKRLNLGFLYYYGYDFASRYVHPMADDGSEDFYTTTKLEPTPAFPDHRSVLSNTLLVMTLIVQKGLNASSLSWHAAIYDFVRDLREFLDCGIERYKVSFPKIVHMIEQGMELSARGVRET